jgi:hypothetical protein
MMSFLSLSPRNIQYTSVIWHESGTRPGVRYATKRISLTQRLELARGLHELMAKNEFLQAGSSLEQAEASIADLLVRRLYLNWGVSQIEGLVIDGRPASVQSVIDSGPENLSNEMIAQVRSELELSEAERKNF